MPLGREEVKLQWQVAPLGTPYTSTTGVISGTSASWTDVLTTGVTITENVTGLTAETAYHWRVRLHLRPPRQPAGAGCQPLGAHAVEWLAGDGFPDTHCEQWREPYDHDHGHHLHL